MNKGKVAFFVKKNEKSDLFVRNPYGFQIISRRFVWRKPEDFLICFCKVRIALIAARLSNFTHLVQKSRIGKIGSIGRKNAKKLRKRREDFIKTLDNKSRFLYNNEEKID